MAVHIWEIPEETVPYCTIISCNLPTNQQCQKHKAAARLADNWINLTGFPSKLQLRIQKWFSDMVIGILFNSSMVWISKKKHKIRIWTAKKNMKNLNILSCGIVCPISAIFCPISVIFCPSCSWFFWVVDQIQPDFFINSGLQFQIKLKFAESQNQYSGNKMRHEPVQSLQNMPFTTNTRQACHSLSLVTFWILNYWAYCLI